MTKHTPSAPALIFNDTKFRITTRTGQPWLRGAQIAEALGYSQANRVADIYNRHAAEFTDTMTAVVKLKTKGGDQEVRIFSLRGAHLLGMFARTEKAAEFRRWILDILDNEIEAQAECRAKPGAVALTEKPVLKARAGHYHYPRSHLEQPYYTNPGTGKVTLTLSMLGDTTHFVSPLMALLNQLRSEGFDVSAPFDEAVAMRSVLQQADRDLEAMSSLALKARFRSASKERNHD